jgi:serine/threonine protein kinase
VLLLWQRTISREVQTMILVDHPNVLKSHCSFVSDHNLWVVMPYMSGGSCLHILKAAYPDGFEELVIATILREVLKGIDYLHHQGYIHRDVKVCKYWIFKPFSPILIYLPSILPFVLCLTVAVFVTISYEAPQEWNI